MLINHLGDIIISVRRQRQHSSSLGDWSHERNRYLSAVDKEAENRRGVYDVHFAIMNEFIIY